MQEAPRKPRNEKVRPLRYVLGTESARTSHLRQECPEETRETHNMSHQTVATALAVTYRVLQGSPQEGNRRVRPASRLPAVDRYRD